MNHNSFGLSEKCGIVNQKTIPFSILLATIPELIPEKMPKMAKESELKFLRNRIQHSSSAKESANDGGEAHYFTSRTGRPN